MQLRQKSSRPCRASDLTVGNTVEKERLARTSRQARAGEDSQCPALSVAAVPWPGQESPCHWWEADMGVGWRALQGREADLCGCGHAAGARRSV